MPGSTTPRPLTILVVDDNRDTAGSYATLLTCPGHRVRTASHGEDAVRAAVVFPPDVMLIDLTMPGMDGAEVACRVRAAGLVPSLIAVTGRETEAERQRAWRAGFELHLLKPVEPAALVHILAEYQRRIAARG